MNESFNNKVEPYAPVENAGRFNYEQTANGNSYRSPELERLGELAHEYAESANQTTELLQVNYIKLDSPEPEKNPLTPEQEIAAASQNVVKFRTECLEGEFGLAA
mgnify:FL=1